MSAYSAIILAEPSLVSYWKLDEPSGTSAADSKGSNTGTYSGTYTPAVTGIAGDGNTAVNFSTNGQVTIGNPANLQLVAPFSLEAWVKAPVGDVVPIITKYSGASGFAGWGVRFGGTTTRKFDFWTGAGGWFTGTTVYSLNAYHHVVCTLSGTTATIYVDGVLDRTGTVSLSLATAADVVIGKNNTADNSNSIIDEVAVYSAALSLSDVVAHYNAGSVADVPGAMAVTESHNTQVAAATNTFGATMSRAEALDVMIAAEPSAALLQLVARRDSGTMVGHAVGGFVFPATRPDGICKWYPGLKPRARQARARI